MYFELWDRAQARRVGRYFTLVDAQNAARAFLVAAEAIDLKFTLELLEMERGYKGRTLAAFGELEAMVRPRAETPESPLDEMPHPLPSEVP